MMNWSKILEISKSNKGLKSRIIKKHIESNNNNLSRDMEKGYEQTVYRSRNVQATFLFAYLLQEVM